MLTVTAPTRGANKCRFKRPRSVFKVRDSTKIPEVEGSAAVDIHHYESLFLRVQTKLMAY